MRVARYTTLAIALFYVGAASASDLINATMHKMPFCDCCEGHAEHLRANGIEVKIVEVEDLAPLRRAEGVPMDLEGCHTILVGGYVVEGHVSADSIKHLLSERPKDIAGISMPGMPTGVPGMPGPKEGPIEVFAFGAEGQTLFAVE